MNKNKKLKNIASPCVGVCIVDANNCCEGCFRTVDEITRWPKMEYEEKKQAVLNSWQRAKAAGRIL